MRERRPSQTASSVALIRALADQGLVTRLWSEPLVGLRRREVMRAEVERAGLRASSDTGAADWARQLGAPFDPENPAANLRLLVAERPGAG
ncbi:hypothetical protein WMF26_42475 [Sorangium sp. So ce185]|uniref:hypothetical protein n=1 Tax=Sorangium sp. So ce185 TaxID=3133287 RepID=UPI003F61F228